MTKHQIICPRKMKQMEDLYSQVLFTACQLVS